MISGSRVSIRPVKITDFDLLFKWENDQKNWEISGTKKSYTLDELFNLHDSSQDLVENNQFRFVISDETNCPIGTLDLFEANFQNRVVGLGILIAEAKNRRKGYGKQAVKLLIDDLRKEAFFECIFCIIQNKNEASMQLFRKCGFKEARDEKEFAIFDLNSEECTKMTLWLKK